MAGPGRNPADGCFAKEAAFCRARNGGSSTTVAPGRFARRRRVKTVTSTRARPASRLLQRRRFPSRCRAERPFDVATRSIFAAAMFPIGCRASSPAPRNAVGTPFESTRFRARAIHTPPHLRTRTTPRPPMATLPLTRRRSTGVIIAQCDILGRVIVCAQSAKEPPLTIGSRCRAGDLAPIDS